MKKPSNMWLRGLKPKDKVLVMYKYGPGNYVLQRLLFFKRCPDGKLELTIPVRGGLVILPACGYTTEYGGQGVISTPCFMIEDETPYADRVRFLDACMYLDSVVSRAKDYGNLELIEYLGKAARKFERLHGRDEQSSQHEAPQAKRERARK